MNRKLLLSGLVGLFSFTLLVPSTKAQNDNTLAIDITQAIEIALSDNPTIKIADKEIEKKKYAKKGAYAPLFPQINISGDYNRTLKKQVMYMDGAFGAAPGEGEVPEGGAPEGSVPEIPEGGESPMTPGGGIEIGRKNNWSAGVNFSMPLIAPMLWKSLEVSAVDVELSIEAARSSKISMVNQVKKSFYAVLLAQDSYDVFKMSYDNASMNYKDVKKKYEQGLVAEYDMIRADVQVKNIEPSLFQAENALSLSLWRLKALLGMNLELNITCKGSLVDFENYLYSSFLSTDTSLVNNTDLRQLDLQKKMLGKTLMMQKFEYIPTLSLSGLYQFTSMNNDFKFSTYQWNPYSMVGVKLNIPLFVGGARKQKIAQTRVSMEQIDLQRDDVNRNLQLVIKQYTDNMSTSVKQFNASQQAVKQAQRGHLIAQKRYENGMATLLELNDADLALTQARLTFNQSIYDYMVSKSELEKTLGDKK